MSKLIALDKVLELIEEATERIVILYANLSGRENAHRAEFRKEVRILLIDLSNRLKELN